MQAATSCLMNHNRNGPTITGPTQKFAPTNEAQLKKRTKPTLVRRAEPRAGLSEPCGRRRKSVWKVEEEIKWSGDGDGFTWMKFEVARMSSLSSASSLSSSAVRSWRTAFLTLRDETLASPPPSAVLNLLQHLLFSNSQSLIAAAPDLPPHEVFFSQFTQCHMHKLFQFSWHFLTFYDWFQIVSDIMFLMELVPTCSDAGDDTSLTFISMCHLVFLCFSAPNFFFLQRKCFSWLFCLLQIHDVCQRVSLEINSPSWALMLDTFGTMVESFLGKAGSKRVFSENAARIKAVMECVETVRFVHSPCLLIFNGCTSKLELKLYS